MAYNALSMNGVPTTAFIPCTVRTVFERIALFAFSRKTTTISTFDIHFTPPIIALKLFKMILPKLKKEKSLIDSDITVNIGLNFVFRGGSCLLSNYLPVLEDCQSWNTKDIVL